MKDHRVYSLTFGVLVVVAILLAAGCSRVGNSMLQFSPASFPECKGPNIVVRVNWDATRKTKENIRIQVYKPGNAPKVWYMGPPKGQRDTDKWMADGSTMRLIDAKERVLAMRTMETTRCN